MSLQEGLQARWSRIPEIESMQSCLLNAIMDFLFQPMIHGPEYVINI